MLLTLKWKHLQEKETQQISALNNSQLDVTASKIQAHSAIPPTYRFEK